MCNYKDKKTSELKRIIRNSEYNEFTDAEFSREEIKAIKEEVKEIKKEIAKRKIKMEAKSHVHQPFMALLTR